MRSFSLLAFGASASFARAFLLRQPTGAIQPSSSLYRPVTVLADAPPLTMDPPVSFVDELRALPKLTPKKTAKKKVTKSEKTKKKTKTSSLSSRRSLNIEGMEDTPKPVSVSLKPKTKTTKKKRASSRPAPVQKQAEPLMMYPEIQMLPKALSVRTPEPVFQTEEEQPEEESVVSIPFSTVSNPFEEQQMSPEDNTLEALLASLPSPSRVLLPVLEEEPVEEKVEAEVPVAEDTEEETVAETPVVEEEKEEEPVAEAAQEEETEEGEVEGISEEAEEKEETPSPAVPVKDANDLTYANRWALLKQIVEESIE
uniref:Uncharacterized protein n=1 Tax=Chromera velia CCMP2878 TaxID=1169474 RepID=A0A0G4GKH0_9ALVE|mmetsp:Transcript_32394/g.64310  ORF Transcript_32394/g.64310 Transcript_32394/m.64310 type:complete len:312 (+) Transcript_32394:213-1148(+)|eukprot:Cvel_4828.t1-p1 / transcript=Cvel_4828.t1 / gene=Cvel_4828 / organism=Chromera_velia_CCMP2878 / gene_product=hypothetical protein / transcript_product=hypothetical protein / location=Cvel_scaffold217:91830-93126(-) / protein_length=311 / sequence_SO=supercontig / SO=protein_coding / is_pseudo=false